MQLWLVATLATGHLVEEEPFLHRTEGASPDANLVRRRALLQRGVLSQEAASAESSPLLPGAETDGGTAAANAEAEAAARAEEPEYTTIYHSKSDVLPPVPTSMQCVIDLTLQYFFVYTFMAVVVTYQDLRLSQRTSLVAGLKSAFGHACNTVNAAPMLALLFLTVEMRAAFVGSTHLSDWVTTWMRVGTSAIAVQTLMVLLLPAMTGELVECDDEGHMKNPSVPYSFMAKVVVVVRYLTLALLYSAVVVVIYALLSLKGLNPREGDLPAMALPLQAVVNLVVQYFAVALGLVLVRTFADEHESRSAKAVAAMQVAFSTVSMAPMLAVVYMLARLRALQIDPGTGALPAYTDWCFYAGTYALLAQTLLVIVCTAVGGEPVKGKVEGDFGIAAISPTFYYPLTAARYLAMLCMYAAVVGIMTATVNLKAESGPTPAVSVTAHNTFVLAAAFFAVYLAQYLLNNLRDFFSQRYADQSYAAFPNQRVDQRLHQTHREAVWIKWIKTVENARCTVQVCPMLAILFLAVRARALQVTGGLGGPQDWAQASMWLCTNAVLVQLVMVLVVALLIDNIPQTNRAGQVTSEPSTIWLRVPLTILRYLAFLCLYGGLVAVLVSAFVLTPERASPIQ